MLGDMGLAPQIATELELDLADFRILAALEEETRNLNKPDDGD